MTDAWTTLADWLFKGWQGIGRIIVVGVLAYIGLLIILRISGKRTLSKMNAFDLVVTVALGSTLSTIIVSKETGVADGLTAMALLVVLQYGVAWLSVRWRGFKRFIKGEPSLLFHQGSYLKQAMRQQRVTEDEILAAMRSAGASCLEDVTAVVLENDGSFTVIQGRNQKPTTSLQNVE